MNYERMTEPEDEERSVQNRSNDDGNNTRQIPQGAQQNDAENNPEDNVKYFISSPATELQQIINNNGQNNITHNLTGNAKYYIASSTTGTVTILTETVFGFFVAPDLHPHSLALCDESTQKLFLCNIYTILMTQLLFTTGVISIFLYHEATKHFVLENKEVIIPALIVNIIIVIMTSCSEKIRRQHPINLVVLIIFSCTMSLFFGIATSLLKTHYLLLMITVMTAVNIAAVIIFVMQTKYKFTPWRCGGITIIISFLALGLSAGFLLDSFWEAALGIFVALVVCSSIIFDAQRIICGWHTYEFKPNEYTFGALSLYFDSIDFLIPFSRVKKRSPILVLSKQDLPASLRNA
ncbi:protein lifeguard 2-like [Drosophila nasuta]|uniref:protein lifeguard 2-like n=1 Tax=Drosophila nasuta TaxID=42062 RepID=UPI00295E98F5|nr:protein lifeguard 2-like [Drosophila nasuta]